MKKYKNPINENSNNGCAGILLIFFLFVWISGAPWYPEYKCEGIPVTSLAYIDFVEKK